MKKNLAIVLVLLLIVSFISIYNITSINLSWKNNTSLDKNTKKNNVSPNVTDVMENENNIPEKYKKYSNLESFFEDRLNDEKYINVLSWKNIDLKNDNIVLCEKLENWNIVYTPFYNSKYLKWEYDIPEVRYDYMKIFDNSIEQDCIHWWYWSNSNSIVLMEEDVRHPLKKDIDDVFNRRVNVDSFIKELENIKDRWEKYNELLAYFYDFRWMYDKANDLRKSKLKDKKTEVTITWVVSDKNWNAIEWVKVTLLNNNKKFVYTDKDWKYEFKFKSYPLSHLRVRVTKEWYADWYFSIYLDRSLDPSWEMKVEENLVLESADNSIIIDFNKYDKTKEFMWKKYFIVESSQSTYYVPYDLYYFNLDKFEWDKIKVYLYEFTKWDNIDNLVEVDTFSPVYWYVWNLMKTFWMPYIQFFDMNWEEIFIKEENPMLLTNKIYHMKELYENYDKIYEAITTWDMEFLVKKSEEEWWFPITYDWLIENNFLRWPVWWTLDRKRWTWLDVPHRVVDTSWVVQLKFYQIK